MLTRRDFTSKFAYEFYLDTVADLKANRRLVSHLDESCRFLADSVYVLENQYTVQSDKNQKLEATLAELKSELDEHRRGACCMYSDIFSDQLDYAAGKKWDCWKGWTDR